MILTDVCGQLSPSGVDTIRRHVSALYTPSVTGPVELEIFNWRSGLSTDPLNNYVDNFFIQPLNPDFETDLHDISIFNGGSSQLSLTAGGLYAGKNYLILSGLTGTWPGFLINGLEVPLNLDSWTWIAYSLANSPIMSNFSGSLDGSGNAKASFNISGGLPISAAGMPLYFIYLVHDGPVIKTSEPLYILLTW